MKRVFTFLSLTLIIPVLAVTANAALVDNGDGTITDTDRGLMWLKDAGLGVITTSWYDAMRWAENLTYADYDDWMLPSARSEDGSDCFGYDCVDSEFGHIYLTELGNAQGGPRTNDGPFINFPSQSFWTRDVYDQEAQGGWIYVGIFDFQYGHSGAKFSDWPSPEASWAVRIVPEPISSILFVAGGTLLAGRRILRKRKRSKSRKYESNKTGHNHCVQRNRTTCHCLGRLEF